MNTTVTRLKQLNPAVPDETIDPLVDALSRGDAAGWRMLGDYFTITRETALGVATDVSNKRMDL